MRKKNDGNEDKDDYKDEEEEYKEEKEYKEDEEQEEEEEETKREESESNSSGRTVKRKNRRRLSYDFAVFKKDDAMLMKIVTDSFHSIDVSVLVVLCLFTS